MQNNPENNAPDKVFEQGVAAAASENYLGNFATVQFLLRTLGAKCINRFDPEKKEECMKQDVEDCKELAKTFLGENPDYSPVPAWNKAGVIDDYLARVQRLEGDDPQKRVAAVLMRFLGDIYGLYTYALSGPPPENWETQIDGICDMYTKLMIGFEDNTITAEDLETVTED